jgi:hypothetical protein
MAALIASMVWAGCCQSDCEDEGLDAVFCENYCSMTGSSNSTTREMAENSKAAMLSSKRYQEEQKLLEEWRNRR